MLTRSTRLAPGTYHLPAPADTASAVLVIRGDSLTLDLRGVVLRGQPRDGAPDAARGTAIRVEGGRQVRILGGAAHGYHTGILAAGTVGLTIAGFDGSNGWAPRLYSGVVRESLVDWLSFHRNEAGEWRRFGAAIHLEGVRGGVVTGARATHGMNGLLMSRTERVRVVGNTFAFNSGLGIGLYRASHNVIATNVLDYNVRGYSHGHYARGQDSAALLLFEQSSGNLIAWNSATHSGDGLFLWAGQHTMDTGGGGSNDNLVVGNDFRWSPTNAMEATFSRNRFRGNLAGGSTHGLWGGYGWEVEVAGNCFGGNRVGIAIEHGQDTRIVGNAFEADTTAIRLWANPIAPSDWGYPRHRDTRSRDMAVAGNRIADARVALRAAATERLAWHGNRLERVDSALVLDDTSAAALLEDGVVAPGPGPCGPAHVDRSGLPPAIRDLPPAAGLAADRDRSAIVIGPWGPYDWQRPLVWPLDDPLGGAVRLRVLGPEGRWRLGHHAGLRGRPAADGSVGDTLLVLPDTSRGRVWEVELLPEGGGEPFGYAIHEPAVWRTRFRVLPAGWVLPLSEAALEAALAGAPVLERRMPALDLVWYSPPDSVLPREGLLTEATTEFDLPPGAYTLGTISDDAVRVWVDGRLVIDHWAPHESALDFAPLAGGRHAVRVLHVQGAGWTELRVFVAPGDLDSPGSPGPH